jgi:hypothetical protein
VSNLTGEGDLRIGKEIIVSKKNVMDEFWR